MATVSYDKKDNIEVVVISDVPEFEYHNSVTTESDIHKLTTQTERIIRSSMEYGDYIQYLRENVGMNACAFFNNVNRETSKKIRIEVHHAPLTLYDITKIVIKKFLATGEEIDDLMIAEEVMDIHYHNQVGLIPLSKTLHEVVHKSDKLTIPMYMIYGDFNAFLRNYEEYWQDDEAIKAKIQKLVEVTKAIKSDTFDVLKPKFTYLKVDGFEMPVKIEDKEVLQEVANVKAKAA